MRLLSLRTRYCSAQRNNPPGSPPGVCPGKTRRRSMNEQIGDGGFNPRVAVCLLPILRLWRAAARLTRSTGSCRAYPPIHCALALNNGRYRRHIARGQENARQILTRPSCVTGHRLCVLRCPPLKSSARKSNGAMDSSSSKLLKIRRSVKDHPQAGRDRPGRDD